EGERVGNGRVDLAQVVDELTVLLPDAPVRLLVGLEQRANDAGRDAPALLQEQVAQRAEPAREMLVEAADEIGNARAREPPEQVGLQRVVGRLAAPGADAAREVVAAEVQQRV